MQTVLGGKQGQSSGARVLKSLVQANAVSVRPFSPIFPAKDIPIEVRLLSSILGTPSLPPLFPLKFSLVPSVLSPHVYLQLLTNALSNRSGGMVKQPLLQPHLLWPSIA